MAAMQPEDVYRLSGVADPRISPDGAMVAYVVSRIDADSKEGRSAIWAMDPAGSAPPRLLTRGPKNDAQPRWSPDGGRLAFTSDRAGGSMQLYVVDAHDPADPVKLTALKEDVDAVVWSPDGTRIAFVARDHDPLEDVEDVKKRGPRRLTRLQHRLDDEGWTQGRETHIWVVDADGASPAERITSGEAEDASPAWHPDGSRLVFVSARHDDWDLTTLSDLFVVSATGGELQRLTPTDGACAMPSWSPDGATIAFHFWPGQFDEPRHAQVAVIDVATKERRILTQALDRNCAPFPPVREPVWDGGGLLFTLEDGGTVPLYGVAADGGAGPKAELAFDGCITGFDLVDGRLVYVRSDPMLPSELFSADRALTQVSAPLRESVELVEPTRFTAASADGSAVEAWIMRPVGFDPAETYPAVLNVHGGPFTQYTERFFDEFQVQASAGYVVIYANPRGSSGYSEVWGRAIRGPVEGGPGWGSVDADDLMAVVDTALERFGFIDPERLGVMGGSYGGFMTSWLVGHSDRFACGISERAVNDMASEDGASDIGGFFRGYVGAHPWEDAQAYRDLSPLTYVDQIKTPLLIVHSEDDLRCPIGQAEQLFTTLRSLQRPVEFVRFPGEGHELSRSGSPTHRVMRFQIILDWLGRYLGPAGQTG